MGSHASFVKNTWNSRNTHIYIYIIKPNEKWHETCLGPISLDDLLGIKSYTQKTKFYIVSTGVTGRSLRGGFIKHLKKTIFYKTPQKYDFIGIFGQKIPQNTIL